MAEIARVVENFPGVAKAKQIWPGATVEAVRHEISDPLDGIGREELNDSISF